MRVRGMHMVAECLHPSRMVMSSTRIVCRRYYPDMTPSEVLLFKQDDTRRSPLPGGIARSRWTPHTSFFEQGGRSARRESIELRVACAFRRQAKSKL